MKKAILFVAAALMLGSWSLVSTESMELLIPGRYQIDLSASSFNWLGKKVTGEHGGTINAKMGDISVEKGQISYAKIVIDMESMVCTDAEMNDEYKGKLIGHLFSPDFFDVANHKTATLEMRKFTPVKQKDANVIGEGKLTIKGISQNISVPMTVSNDGKTLTANGTLTFDRTKYEIRYGSGSFFDDLGDNMIYDDVELTFDLKANVASR